MARTEENYLYRGDHYCYPCLPVVTDHPEVYDASGEQDTPAHCYVCSIPLSYSLTSHGVQYVIDALLDELAHWPERGTQLILDTTYYHGCRQIEICRGWAEEIRWYSLDAKDKFIVDRFLEVTAGDAPPLPRPQPLFVRSRRAFDWLAIRQGD